MSDSLGLAITKIVATGNDFVFIDGREAFPKPFDAVSREELAKKICDRHFGVGADGLVIVEDRAGRLAWDFYNSDGSPAEMCGNATRCMGRWLEKNLGSSIGEFQTAAGLVYVTIEKESVRSRLDFVSAQPRKIDYLVGGERRSAMFVNTGVPHAVRLVEKIQDAENAKDDIEALRFHPDTGARGANVTFLEVVDQDHMNTVTFERGVEDFTLSCGTGVLAAAAVGLSRGGGLHAHVETPGGNLVVHYGKGFQGVTLEGPAQIVFETVLAKGFLT